MLTQRSKHAKISEAEIFCSKIEGLARRFKGCLAVRQEDKAPCLLSIILIPESVIHVRGNFEGVLRDEYCAGRSLSPSSSRMSHAEFTSPKDSSQASGLVQELATQLASDIGSSAGGLSLNEGSVLPQDAESAPESSTVEDDLNTAMQQLSVSGSSRGRPSSQRNPQSAGLPWRPPSSATPYQLGESFLTVVLKKVRTFNCGEICRILVHCSRPLFGSKQHSVDDVGDLWSFQGEHFGVPVS